MSILLLVLYFFEGADADGIDYAINALPQISITTGTPVIVVVAI